jgi:hypothetical protein
MYNLYKTSYNILTVNVVIFDDWRSFLGVFRVRNCKHASVCFAVFVCPSVYPYVWNQELLVGYS